MAKKCDICGKGPRAGNSISHAHNVTKRRFLPNVKKMWVIYQGKRQYLKVCTRCLRSGRVEKVA